MRIRRTSLCSICGGHKTGRKCPRCARAPDRRETACQRGYDRRWRVAQRVYLARPEHRICRICNNRLAECIDHIVDHHGNAELFWDEKNWQPACIACNTRKAQSRSTRSRKR